MTFSDLCDVPNRNNLTDILFAIGWSIYSFGKGFDAGIMLEGIIAHKKGQKLSENTYIHYGTSERASWSSGWLMDWTMSQRKILRSRE